MNPNEALNILDGVCAQVTMKRQDHARCVEAVNVLRSAINPPVPLKVEGPEKATEEKGGQS